MGRKQKKYHYIYKTTNLLNGKYYIGMHSTDDLNDGYMGSGRRLRYSINKYGKDKHKVEILEFVDTREELIKREEEVVNLNEIAKVDCINLRVGGTGGFRDEAHHDKFQKARGDNFKLKFENDPEFKIKHIKNFINISKQAHKDGKTHKIDYDWTGKKHSEETKQKMSELSKGKGKGEANSQYGKCWITNGSSITIWLEIWSSDEIK
jgi:hypothetical protein